MTWYLVKHRDYFTYR